MAATVLSGTSGALYYKPAGTTGTFGETNVDASTDIITLPAFLNLKVDDPVKFSVVNTQTGGAGTGTLPAGLTAGTEVYILTYNASTGATTVSATAGGSAIDITDDGTATGNNAFQIAYSDFEAVGQVQNWSFEINRAEIDVTTIGQTPGQFAPFRAYIPGFADGSGSATIFTTDSDTALSSRMVEDVLQRQQVGCAFKLYIDQIFTGGAVDNTQSRSIAMNATLLTASLSVNPDDAQVVEITFRPTDTPTFDLSKSA